MPHRRGVIGVGRTIGNDANTINTRNHFGMVDHYEQNDFNFKSTALNPSSYSYAGARINNPNGDDVFGLGMSPDGTKLYTQSYAYVKLHNLTRPFDLNTVGTSSTYRDFDNNTSSYGFDIASDGNSMFMGKWSSEIIKYKLNNPYVFFDTTSGQQSFLSTGTSNFTVPDNVTVMSAVVVGAGGGGSYTQTQVYPGGGGGGGGLAYGTFSVTPGEQLTIVIGSGGAGGTFGFDSSTRGKAGGDSQIKRGSTILLQGSGGSGGGPTGFQVGTGGAGGGSTGTVREAGGTGGAGGSPSNYGNGGGGGGAAGYTGNGGAGSNSGSSGATGSGGGGGGGGSDSSATNNARGGGVGLLGAGDNGTGGSSGSSAGNGNPGSGGSGAAYGGGGGGAKGGPTGPYSSWPSANGQSGYQGAARIVYGTGRVYPTASNVGETSTTVEPFAGRKHVDHSAGYNSTNGLNQYPSAICFKPDGHKMYTTGTGDDQIAEWDLTTPWDPSTKVLNDILDISSKHTHCASIVFAADSSNAATYGKILMTHDRVTDKVYRYNLTTAWDITTASYSQEYSFEYGENNPYGMKWKSDGTRFWHCANGQYLYQWDVSSAWDLTSTISSSGSARTIGTTLMGLDWNSDGTQLITVIYGNEEAKVYSVATAYDSQSTLTLLGTIDLDDSRIGITDVRDVFASNDSNNPYVYFFGRDAGKNIVRYNMHSITDFKSIDLGFFDYSSYSSYTDIEWKPDGMAFFFSRTGGYINKVDVSYPFNFNPYLDATVTSLNVGSYLANPRSFTFKGDPSGRTLCVSSNDNSSRMYVFRLTQPWSLTSATVDPVYIDLSEHGSSSGNRAMTISNNRASMLFADRDNDNVQEYKLTF